MTEKGALSSRLESNLVACAKVFAADGILMEAYQFSRVDVRGSKKLPKQKSLSHRRLIRSPTLVRVSVFIAGATPLSAAGESAESSERRWQPGLQLPRLWMNAQP